ncbi:MAG: hypothetical protein RL318_890 [Fibrobacterota bacterium]|jgi:cobalt/nickel transport protein
MNAKTKNMLLAAGVVVLALTALLRVPAGKADVFGGTDDQAGAVIETLKPGYKPWFAPLWEPPSGEIESLLFGLQSAAGAGALFYALGYWRGRRTAAKGRDA